MHSVIINQTKRIAFQQQFGVSIPKNIKITQISSPQRPTVAEIKQIFLEKVKGKIFDYPKTKNKGSPGQFLERLLGIPTSSECLDCSDGELKAFPLKKLIKDGSFSSEQTVAITMRGLNAKEIHNPKPWEESALKKKTNNMLFISYFREGDNITYLSAFSFGASCPEYAAFKSDYDLITNYYKTHGISQNVGLKKYDQEYRSNTINGLYIQGRTKGGGKNVGNGKKTVSFYFRNTEFMKDVILRDIKQSTHQSSSPQDSLNE